MKAAGMQEIGDLLLKLSKTFQYRMKGMTAVIQSFITILWFYEISLRMPSVGMLSSVQKQQIHLEQGLFGWSENEDLD